MYNEVRHKGDVEIAHHIFWAYGTNWGRGRLPLPSQSVQDYQGHPGTQFDTRHLLIDHRYGDVKHF